jgi:hypothetical protein
VTDFFMTLQLCIRRYSLRPKLTVVFGFRATIFDSIYRKYV